MKNIQHPMLNISVEARTAYHILDGLRRQHAYYQKNIEAYRQSGLTAFAKSNRNACLVIDEIIDSIKRQAIIQGEVI